MRFEDIYRPLSHISVDQHKCKMCDNKCDFNKEFCSDECKDKYNRLMVCAKSASSDVVVKDVLGRDNNVNTTVKDVDNTPIDNSTPTTGKAFKPIVKKDRSLERKCKNCNGYVFKKEFLFCCKNCYIDYITKYPNKRIVVVEQS